MDKHKSSTGAVILFLLLWTLDSCFGENLFHVGGLGVYYHLPFMLLIIAAGGLAFLVNPQLGRGQAVALQGVILLLPILFTVGWSGFIWIINRASGSEIRRGIVSAGYLFFGTLAMVSTAYVVREKAFLIYLASLVIANFQMIAGVIFRSGLTPFLREFAELLLTFAGTTGDIMESLEIHSITYGLGAFLVYFCVGEREARKMLFLIPAALLCYLTGLKRISVLAAFAGIILGHLFLAFKKYPSAVRLLLKILGAVFLAGALAYVGAVYYGLYDYLEEIGINTNYRATIYSSYRQYYTFSPSFIGHGAGWSDNLFRNTVTGAAAGSETIRTMPHNDYMKVYMELGMFGFLIWCYFKCNFQVKQAFRLLGAKGGAVALALTGYLAITFLTDPTSTQVHVNCAIAGILLSYRLDTRADIYEQKMENANRRLSESPYGG